MGYSLSSFFSHIWDTLRRPRALFATIVDGSELAPALAWIVLLGILAGVTGTYAGLNGKTEYGQDWWQEFPIRQAVGQSIWFCLSGVLWAALLTWGLARLVRETLRFDALLTVLSLSAAPCLLTTLTFPIRNGSWIGLQCWQALNVVVVVWVCALICLGVQACLRTCMTKAVQCCLPALIIFAAIGNQAGKAKPTSFRAACRWEQWEGRHVRMYYPPGKSKQDVEALGRGLDTITEQDCGVLDEKPLPFKIDVFCFADDEQQRRFAGSSEEPDNTAHTYWDCITVSYDTWDNLHAQMAHEICHVLMANRLADNVHGLLDEGLCEYVAHTVVPPSEDLPVMPATAIPLRTLARPDVFFDWDQVQEEGEPDPDADWRHYRSGELLTEYLIGRYGMDKYKLLYRSFAQHAHDKDGDNDEGKQLSHAVQDVYRLPLKQLETEWRQAMKPARLPASSS